MKYIIRGDNDCPVIEITLNNQEVVKIERGSMAYMANVQIEGKLNSSKKGLSGMLGAIGRSLTSGESMFITHATGLSNNATLGVAPAIPGKVKCLSLDPSHQYYLNTGAFVACDNSVDYQMISQKASKAFFGGTGGFFIMQTTGYGDMIINGFGDIIEMEVTPNNPLTIDNDHVLAWETSLDYSIKVASGTFGFTSGEGLVDEFYGSGKVYIQTRNIQNLAQVLIPYLPTSNNS